MTVESAREWLCRKYDCNVESWEHDVTPTFTNKESPEFYGKRVPYILAEQDAENSDKTIREKQVFANSFMEKFAKMERLARQMTPMATSNFALVHQISAEVVENYEEPADEHLSDEERCELSFLVVLRSIKEFRANWDSSSWGEVPAPPPRKRGERETLEEKDAKIAFVFDWLGQIANGVLKAQSAAIVAIALEVDPFCVDHEEFAERRAKWQKVIRKHRAKWANKTI
ncbi:MAG: hypothetical protein GY822_17010 [Deltaproteobacteria bacterium]|nr:hypothetical protein [Deltaproteobacteria bacterium]